MITVELDNITSLMPRKPVVCLLSAVLGKLQSILRQPDKRGRVSAAWSSGGEDLDSPDWERCEHTGPLQINSRGEMGCSC